MAKETATQITTSIYDAANELLTAEDSSGITSYTYDNNGNQRSVETPAAEITTYSWDYENRTRSIEFPDSSLVTYIYDPNNQQDEFVVQKITETETTKYFWDNSNILQEYDVTTDAQYNYAPQAYGNLISQYRSTESNYYHYDGNFSTAALTDSTQVESDTYRYNAFGETLDSSGTTQNPYTYKGEIGYYQDENGLQLLRNRRYSPEQGRFISEDPIGLDSSESNFYSYVANNPANEIDPSGLESSTGTHPGFRPGGPRGSQGQGIVGDGIELPDGTFVPVKSKSEKKENFSSYYDWNCLTAKIFTLWYSAYWKSLGFNLSAELLEMQIDGKGGNGVPIDLSKKYCDKMTSSKHFKNAMKERAKEVAKEVSGTNISGLMYQCHPGEYQVNDADRENKDEKIGIEWLSNSELAYDYLDQKFDDLTDVQYAIGSASLGYKNATLSVNKFERPIKFCSITLGTKACCQVSFKGKATMQDSFAFWKSSLRQIDPFYDAGAFLQYKCGKKPVLWKMECDFTQTVRGCRGSEPNI